MGNKTDLTREIVSEEKGQLHIRNERGRLSKEISKCNGDKEKREALIQIQRALVFRCKHPNLSDNGVGCHCPDCGWENASKLRTFRLS